MIEITLAAPTPEDAYTLATQKYGSDIEILTAKQVFNPKDDTIQCEIVVAVEKEKFLQPAKRSSDSEQKEKFDEKQEQELLKLQEEIAKLKDKMVEMSQDDGIVERVKKLFESKGIERAWLDEVLASLGASIAKESEEKLVSFLLEEMDDTIEIKNENLSKQKIMMFVGPTGVGKTTTVAKLAARYAYMLDEPRTVALINLDSFKIGAFEQLAHFADVMKLQHFGVQGVEEFKEVFAKVMGYDVILIDTAGMSPFDTQKLVKTVEYLATHADKKIEVNLVISSTIKFEDAVDIYQTFSFLNLSSVILSKFDETKHLGSILSYILMYPVPLSYFSVGQGVPDDLMLADKEYLLQRFIGDLDA